MNIPAYSAATQASLILILLAATPVFAADCRAESGTFRVPVLELYTSEGCDSCPPTDRWVNGLPQRGYTAARVLPLAFHVDYWNYLGWQDPYAQAAFSNCQREISRRNKARIVYTPQLILDGTDYRRSSFRDDFGERIAAINHQQPRAKISISIDDKMRLRGTVTVHDVNDRKTARIYIAVYENGLSTDIKAGENKGKRLSHEFVVRALSEPITPDAAGTVS